MARKRYTLQETLLAGLSWLGLGKSVPPALTGGQWTGTSYTDSYKRNRAPNANELLAELKNTAWTCASINASVCAAYPPRLYVTTDRGQASPKCATRTLLGAEEKTLRRLKRLPRRAQKAFRIEEVADHPLLDLLAVPNPCHNSFDLWELTTLYQEVHGSAFWYLSPGPFGVPEQIWILPSQNVTPKRNPDSQNLVDYYSYRTGSKEQRFAPDDVIHFRYPDPRDPYTAGLAPLRACFEQVSTMSEYAAFKSATYQNHGIPAAIISPDEVVGEEERDRLEAQWNSKFRRGGTGKVVVGETGLKVQLLAHSMGDLAALADMSASKEDVANAFHVPVAYLTSQTNLANLLASQMQHMQLAIDPRLQRRDEKINEQLIPLFDPSGRLFVASEDPTPVDADQQIAQKELDLKYGIVTVNEVRSERGLEPVPWGDVPWLPMQWARTDYTGRADWPAPNVGRNKPIKDDEDNGGKP
jgi:HK97 family phage portal protein